MLPRWARQVIQVVEPGQKTVFGSTTDDWSNPTVREIPGCWTWQASTDELRGLGRDTTVDGYHCNIPPEADPPKGNQRVILPNGGTYNVIGRVTLVPSATGHRDYQTFYAERIENRG